MKAIVLDAEWAPRDGVTISEADAARRWAYNANLTYRNPRFELQAKDDPSAPGPDEVVVRVEACGICGSDVHMYETDEAGYVLLPYHMRCPVTTGHEFAGTVVDVGHEVRDIHAGDLVTVEEIQYCGNCLACRGGFPNECERIEDIGFTIDGGFAEYVRVPVKACWSLNALLDRYATAEEALEVGAMCEPVSVCYEAMFTRAGGFKPGGAVVVFGAGPIGLAAVALAAAAGASILVCVEAVQERRELALKLGATHAIDPHENDPVELTSELSRGRGAAMVVECSGNWPAVMGPVEGCLAVGGKVAVIGMDTRPAVMNLIRYQLTASSLYGSVGHCGGWNFPNVIALMASGRIQMERAITKRTDLQGLPAALASMQDRRDGKVLIKPGLAGA
jgi:threonine dehydrogenase-like Zn-dependent dehydrogenase